MPELAPGVRALLLRIYPQLADAPTVDGLLAASAEVAPEGVTLRRLEDGEWTCEGGAGRAHRQGRGQRPSEALVAWLIAMAAKPL